MCANIPVAVSELGGLNISLGLDSIQQFEVWKIKHLLFLICSQLFINCITILRPGKKGLCHRLLTLAVLQNNKYTKINSLKKWVASITLVT